MTAFVSFLFLQLPGILALASRFLPTVMNLLRRLAEEGQRPANADPQQNPAIPANTLRSTTNDHSEISSSASSEVTTSENGTEYSSPSSSSRKAQ